MTTIEILNVLCGPAIAGALVLAIWLWRWSRGLGPMQRRTEILAVLGALVFVGAGALLLGRSWQAVASALLAAFMGACGWNSAALPPSSAKPTRHRTILPVVALALALCGCASGTGTAIAASLEGAAATMDAVERAEGDRTIDQAAAAGLLRADAERALDAIRASWRPKWVALAAALDAALSWSDGRGELGALVAAYCVVGRSVPQLALPTLEICP